MARKWVITPVISMDQPYKNPIYNWGYNPVTKWDEPPSSVSFANRFGTGKVARMCPIHNFHWSPRLPSIAWQVVTIASLFSSLEFSFLMYSN